MSKLTLLFIAVALSVIFIVGCDTNTNTNANANSNSRAAARTDNANKGGTGLSREDFEKQKGRFEQEAKGLGRKIGTGANDLWLWTKTRGALAAENDLRDSTISVDVDNGVVTLTGSVPDQAQKEKAGQVTRGIEGVTSVKNDIQIAPAGTNANRITNTNRNRNAR